MNLEVIKVGCQHSFAFGVEREGRGEGREGSEQRGAKRGEGRAGERGEGSEERGGKSGKRCGLPRWHRVGRL